MTDEALWAERHRADLAARHAALVATYQELQPGKILLTHLYEMSREVPDCWGEGHAHMVREVLGRLRSGPEVCVPAWYEETPL